MAATQKASPAQVLDALAARPGVSAAELADASGSASPPRPSTSPPSKRPARPGASRADATGGRRLPDRWTATAAEVEHPAPTGAEQAATETAEPASVEPDAGASPAERLGRGALGALVRDYLAARPGEDLAPTQVAKGLGGKSSGAVGNALARLEAAGEARLVSSSPRRYRLVADK